MLKAKKAHSESGQWKYKVTREVDTRKGMLEALCINGSDGITPAT
jgi:hypothetical protein